MTAGVVKEGITVIRGKAGYGFRDMLGEGDVTIGQRPR